MKVYVDMPNEYPSTFYIRDPHMHLKFSLHKYDSDTFDSRINKVNSCERAVSLGENLTMRLFINHKTFLASEFHNIILFVIYFNKFRYYFNC